MRLLEQLDRLPKKYQQFTPSAQSTGLLLVHCKAKIFHFHIHTKNLNHHALEPLSVHIDLDYLKSNCSIPQQNLNNKRISQDLQEGSVMPPQQAAIMMYRSTTIKHVNRAL